MAYPGGILKRWNGAAWVGPAKLKFYDGAAWVQKALKRWDGTAWLEVDIGMTHIWPGFAAAFYSTASYTTDPRIMSTGPTVTFYTTMTIVVA